MLVPVVFWLVLISYNGETTVMPVPYQTYEDCRAAGDTIESSGRGAGSSPGTYSCTMQRRSELSAWLGRDYPDRSQYER